MPLLINWFFLLSFWLLAVYSTSVFESFIMTANSANFAEPTNYYYFQQQIKAIIYTVVIILLLRKFPVKILKNHKFAWAIMILTFIFQCLVFTKLWDSYNWARWWLIPSIQPSEFFKLAYVIFLASRLTRKKRKYEFSSILTYIHYFKLTIIFCILINSRFLNSINYMSDCTCYGPIFMTKTQKNFSYFVNMTMSMNRCLIFTRFGRQKIWLHNQTFPIFFHTRQRKNRIWKRNNMMANNPSINCNLMMRIFLKLIRKWFTKIFKSTRSVLWLHFCSILRRNLIFGKSMFNSSIYMDVSICPKTFTKSSRSSTQINMSLNHFPNNHTNFC